MISRISILFCFIFVSLSLSGQNRFSHRGDKAFAKSDYPEAIANYHQVKILNTAVFRKMALAYFALKEFDQSEKYYQKILEEEKTYQDLLALSQIQMEHSNFEVAILFSERAKSLGAPADLVNARILAIKKIAAGKIKQTDFRREELDLHPQGKCLGISQNSDGILFSDRRSRKMPGNSTCQLYEYDPENPQKSKPKLYAPNLDPSSNIGALCWSADGKNLYYTRWYQRKGKQQMEIVEAVQRKGEWQAKSLLSFNSRKFSCAYPALSPDGKIMYFSSNQPGGEGGMDIYMTYRRGNAWSKPIRLGKAINTNGDEVFPRVLKDGNLWFASDGKVGYGKLDLFYAAKSPSGNWGAVKNAGYRYNSSGNDFSVIDYSDSSGRLIVSDVEDKLRDKIYRIEVQEKGRIQFALKDKDSKKPVTGAQVSLKNTVTNKDVRILPGDKGNGVYRFTVIQADVDRGVLYQIEVGKSGYANLTRIFSPKKEGEQIEVLLSKIPNVNKFTTVLKPIAYPDKKIIFSNIYFNVNANQLSDSSRIVLDRFANFWHQHPNLKIRINGHSDAKGSSNINRKLSLFRANKTKDYLISKGIEAEKIQVHAYGEKFIVNGCSDGVDCPEIKQRENRRVELIFVL
ncbi:OmpA family protein [Ancylomarina longa]|uniref:OmpA-like domain-containing protein n=1 Tax=Ancylomarina longa TaxID=2487017 RepID=A0A434B0A0_9BACT|nr:OmpA family protein [Ancylomarina longa]RUT80137.1 hypothetical protein DLK05_01925 [Ancylomarina longa]